MVVLSTTQVVRRLVLKTSADEQIYDTIYKLIISKLFNYISMGHAPLVTAIILQTTQTIDFDQIEYRSILNSQADPGEKFLLFIELVQSRTKRDESTIITFLGTLLNLDDFSSTSEHIKSIILNNFGDRVDIEEEEFVAIPDFSHKEQLIRHPEHTPKTKRRSSSKITDKIRKYPISAGFIATFLVLILVLSMFWKPIIAFLHAWLIVSGSGEAAFNESSKSLQSTNMSTSTVKTNLNVTSDIPANVTLSTTYPVTIQSQTAVISGDIQPKVLPKYRVIARSYDEYIKRMTSLPPEHEVIVSIVLRSPLDWPRERTIILPNSSEISRLLIDGPIPVDNLIDILSQTANIKLLQIRNTGDKLCHRNQGQLNLVKGIDTRVYLPMLRSVVIQYFTSCTEIYETLATYLEPLRELKSIVFHRSIIDDHNHVFIKKILENNVDSLKELKLAHTRISVSKPFLEDGKSLILQKVETLRLDSVSSDGKDVEIPIGKTLSKIFPNLRVLYNNFGYVEWSNFPNILQCKNLTKMGMGIKVPIGRTFFNVSFFKKYLPNVTAAHISLSFATCKNATIDGPRKNEIIGWENVKHPLSEVVIKSNCKIHAIMSNTAMSLQYYKVQGYKSEKGKYVFTYKNK